MSEQELIEQAFENRSMLDNTEVANAVYNVIERLDKGSLRVAQPEGEVWRVNEWVKKAVLLYFPLCGMTTIEAGPFEYHDKIKLKHDYAAQGVRVVPPATARYGAFIAQGVVMMPSYVNIGA